MTLCDFKPGKSNKTQLENVLQVHFGGIMNNKNITKEDINKAMSYAQYRHLSEELLAQGKTTGSNQSEAMINYTKLGVTRMKRLDKTAQLDESLIERIKAVDEKTYWVALTEIWCGDAGQNLPLINKMAELNDNIEFLLLLRDENLELMDSYLTNGGRSIPKVIFLKSEELEEMGTWGPRPTPVQKMMQDFKENPTMTKPEFAETIQRWYIQDKNQTIQKEFMELLDEWLSVEA